MTSASTLRWSTALAAALALALPAGAAPVDLNQGVTVTSPFNQTSWFLSNSTWDRSSCAGSQGFTISDAVSAGRGDPFDSAWEILVDGAVVTAPSQSVDLTGSTVTVGPVVRSGLNVTTQYYFSQSSAVARIVVFLQNPGGVAASTQVSTVLNLGSDQPVAQSVRGTSSGDTVFTNADNWVVSDDGRVSDPVVTGVYAGPGAAVRPNFLVGGVGQPCGSFDDIAASYNVTIPAGATRSLMFFAGLGGITEASNSSASAIQRAAAFNSPSTFASDWLSGLSTAQQSQIVNWNLQQFTTCAAEGYTGAQLSLCRSVCEVASTPATLTNRIKLYVALYRETPPCGL